MRRARAQATSSFTTTKSDEIMAEARTVMPGGVSGLGGTKDKIAAFQSEDPREEILKYAKIAEEEPLYVMPAYNKTQPQVAAGRHLAKTVEPEEGQDGDEGLH